MRVIVDTNILLRFVIMEDTEQSRIANDLFSAADELVIPTHVLCEMVWVLLSGYKSSREEIQTALAAILKIKKILVREDEAQAGLDMMGKGGGGADGVNAFVGRQMQPAAIFASFDRKAVRILTERGISAIVPE